MLTKIGMILKEMFCRHRYQAVSRVSARYRGYDRPCHSSYNFVCKKCGKLKTIQTYGIDLIKTIDLEVGDERNKKEKKENGGRDA